MTFDLWSAVVAGILAGVVMMLARLLLRGGGLPLRMDVTRIWGTMFGTHGTAGRVVGLVVHLMVSGGVGILYAFGIELAGATEYLWAWGLLGGLMHWLVAGTMMTILPVAHPEIPEEREAPGPFVKNFGSQDVIGFLIGHLAYGLTVAVTYASLAEDAGSAV